MPVDTSTEAMTKLLDTFDNTKENLSTIGHEAAETLFDLGDTMADALEALLAERDALKAERDRFEATLARACLVGGTTYLIERATKAEAEVERLKAPTSQTVKVKPLVWGQRDTARCALGKYQVIDLGPHWEPKSERFDVSLNGSDVSILASIESAKAAAQSDYEARIMAALDVQPVTVQDAAKVPEVQALIEAAYKKGLSDALGIVASID